MQSKIKLIFSGLLNELRLCAVTLLFGLIIRVAPQQHPHGRTAIIAVQQWAEYILGNKNESSDAK